MPAASRNNPNGWMVTFTDLVALMLTFFVMIFAMSTVKTEEWQSLTDSLRENLSTVVAPPPAAPTIRLDVPSPEVTPGANLDYLAEVLRAQLSEGPLFDETTVRRSTGEVIVSLPADLLFDTGDYALTDRASRAVFALGGVLRNVSNRIEVTGHADPRQPVARYPSNWELSLLRARSVAEALREAGYGAPVVARGRGDSRYASLPVGLSEEDRKARARRVDIVIQDAAWEAGP